MPAVAPIPARKPIPMSKPAHLRHPRTRTGGHVRHALLADAEVLIAARGARIEYPHLIAIRAVQDEAALDGCGWENRSAAQSRDRRVTREDQRVEACGLLAPLRVPQGFAVTCPSRRPYQTGSRTRR
jgi:hypothetical protein